MRRAFAACLALAVLMVIVVVRCGFRDPAAPDAAVPPMADASIDAPNDAAVPIDAPPVPKKRPTKVVPKPTPTRPAPKPSPAPTPVRPPEDPPPAITPTPSPDRKSCTQPPNPAGCPAKEPNVNRPCDAEGVRCVYGTSCCPFIYVCKDGAFEAWIQSCD